MATTLSLTSDDELWVTIYNGGRQGICFDFSIQLDDDTQATATFTKESLVTLIGNRGVRRGLAKPVFDNRGTVEVSMPRFVCPDSLSRGREDRCGRFAHPPRCTENICTQAQYNNPIKENNE